MSSPALIAVDGPAASGKSTFSRALARHLGFNYVSTGEMYRGLTWYVQDQGIDPQDAAAVEKLVLGLAFKVGIEGGALVYRIAGIDPLPHVHEAHVTDGVSYVARVGAVRKLLVEQQQGLAAYAPLVMEGRDIGTVVFPTTPFKFYIDADVAIRTERRAAQGQHDSIAARDAIDTQRVHSPLTCAPDAVRFDSGKHDVEELIELAIVQLNQRGLAVKAN